MLEDFKREIMMLSKIDNKNIVKLLGFCDQRNNTYLVSELMEGGSLFDHIKNKNNPKFHWSINLKLIKDITAGMVYLHSNDILHLDLKSLNILLNKESDQAKISDFGLSQINTITSTLSRAPSSRVAKGTTRYMACEIAKGVKPSRKSDVWSFGCILLEFITRELPFSALPDNAIFLMLQNDSAEIPLNFNTDTPQVIADLISKCLVRRPDERPSFDKIEDLFKSVDGDKLKVTLKSQQIKIKSIPQNSSVTNTQNLKTILDGIKTTNNSTVSEKKIEELQREVSNLKLAAQQPQGLNQISSEAANQQKCTTHNQGNHVYPLFEAVSKKLENFDFSQIFPRLVFLIFL
jgi:serine/threonine protein kinase